MQEIIFSKERITLRKSTNMTILVRFRLVKKTKIVLILINLRIIQPCLWLTMLYMCQKETKIYIIFLLQLIVMLLFTI